MLQNLTINSTTTTSTCLINNNNIEKDDSNKENEPPTKLPFEAVADPAIDDENDQNCFKTKISKHKMVISNVSQNGHISTSSYELLDQHKILSSTPTIEQQQQQQQKTNQSCDLFQSLEKISRFCTELVQFKTEPNNDDDQMAPPDSTTNLDVGQQQQQQSKPNLFLEQLMLLQKRNAAAGLPTSTTTLTLQTGQLTTSASLASTSSGSSSSASTKSSSTSSLVSETANTGPVLLPKRQQQRQRQLQRPARSHPPVNNQNYHEARYKTELCLHYRERNHCPHGQHCLFAHGLEELRPYRGRHPKYKTQQCKAFHEQGFCYYGYRCSYIHSESTDTIEYIKRLNQRAQIAKRNRNIKSQD